MLRRHSTSVGMPEFCSLWSPGTCSVTGVSMMEVCKSRTLSLGLLTMLQINKHQFQTNLFPIMPSSSFLQWINMWKGIFPLTFHSLHLPLLIENQAPFVLKEQRLQIVAQQGKKVQFVYSFKLKSLLTEDTSSCQRSRSPETTKTVHNVFKSPVNKN